MPRFTSFKPHEYHDIVVLLLIFSLFFLAIREAGHVQDPQALSLLVFTACTEIIILICIGEIWLHLAHLEVRICSQESELEKVEAEEQYMERKLTQVKRGEERVEHELERVKAEEAVIEHEVEEVRRGESRVERELERVEAEEAALGRDLAPGPKRRSRARKA